jgi:hypothetical protein
MFRPPLGYRIPIYVLTQIVATILCGAGKMPKISQKGGFWGISNSMLRAWEGDSGQKGKRPLLLDKCESKSLRQHRPVISLCGSQFDIRNKYFHLKLPDDPKGSRCNTS